ncbi:MAG: TAXI family TRAP transporter solute-binding subunit [Candidatus Limivicinus sp.]
MKKVLAFLLAAVMVFALCACGGSTAGTTASSKEYSFTTGGDQGTYYGFGGVLAQKISEKTGTKVTAITSGGSKANIENLQAGDAQFGFVQSDVMAYGYEGSRLFEETGAVNNFSTVAALYMEQVQIVTLNPDIKTVADLKGKTVSIGAAGSGVYFNAIDVLGVYGLKETDINPTYQSFGDSTEALQDGQIDAAFVVAGAPTTAVTSLAATHSVYLVSLDDEHIDALIASSPYYSKYVVPAATYNMPSDVSTVAVGAVVIVRDDVPEQDVYNFVSGIFENIDELKQAHDKANELSLDFAASVTSVPYHAGAAKYFTEKGFSVAKK